MKLMYTHRSAENSQYVYYANIILDDDRLLNLKPSYFWFGDADNDVDGSPYWREDPFGQADTRLHYEGKAVNGDLIPGIVVPPQMFSITPEIVLGCIGTAEWHGLIVSCVVFDSGPRSKIGELSPSALRALGAPAPHNGNGGVDYQEVLYRIWPGVPAKLEIAGTIYRFDLQPA